jgi:4-diphosphocytidyl-2-C-methyl-D-erythritol kinase
VKACTEAELAALAKALHNDFEVLAMAGVADAREAKAALLEAGCLGAGLSGSGSAVFGVAPHRAAAEDIAAQLESRWSWIKVAPTVPSGQSLLLQEAAER